MSPILLGTPEPHSDEWHDLRANSIGASEIAVVLGLNPWSSPFALWHEKAGNVEPDRAGNASTYWGTLHEPTIADEWARQHPWADVQRCGSYARHDDPWMTASPDRLVVDPGVMHVVERRDGWRIGSYPDAAAVAVLEVKTARAADDWGPDGSDEIPVYYRAQVVQQMHVMEVPVGYVAALIGGSDFRCYTIDYDPDEAQVLVDAGRAFWQSIADGVPPPIDGSESTGATIRRLHPDVDDADAIVPAELADEYRAAVADAKAADAVKASATNRLLAALGSARVAIDPDGRKVATRSVSVPKRFDRDGLRREYPDIEAKFTVAGEPVVRLTPARGGASA